MRGRGPSLPQQVQAMGAGSRHYGATVGGGRVEGAGHRLKAAPGLGGLARRGGTAANLSQSAAGTRGSAPAARSRGPRGWRFPALGGPRAASGGAEGESLGGRGEAAYSVPAPEGSDNSGNKEIRAHRGVVRGLEKR